MSDIAQRDATIAQQAARIAELENERNEQWRLKREAQADRDTGHAVIAELKAQPRSAVVPECVQAWFDAKLLHVKSVDDYNARLEFVKQSMPFGTSADPEYQIMEAANRKVRELVWPMFLGLRDLLAQQGKAVES